MKDSRDGHAIRTLIATYEAALNAADAAAAAAVFAEDGEFYPYNLPTATGTQELQAAYERIFRLITLDIVFTVQDLVVDGDSAYATTSSKGAVTLLEPGITRDEECREVFVFTRRDGQWKVARYMFNKATAPTGR